MLMRWIHYYYAFHASTTGDRVFKTQPCFKMQIKKSYDLKNLLDQILMEHPPSTSEQT